MKIRSGFVSNSSSTCFVCNIHVKGKFSSENLDAVEKKLRDIIKAAIELELMPPDTKFEDIFRLPTTIDAHDLRLLRDYDVNITPREDMFLIYSEGDNTIPYELFSILETIFNAREVHLG